ncbi:non-specific lipid-transfer protein 1-like [Iris pallida]|uniref:Non-specific lipid-transfer protein n=1 Tax=Iris pallida TaxID=29817 RepID=A0AAX6DPI4_IRIPA|nr:non-specific lipid-transfer protein 1-like [Iris pallida]
MARSFISLFVLLALVVLAIAAPRAESTVSCGSVVSLLSPCVSYSRGQGPLTAGCCNGVRGLNGMARTTPDRQMTCNCLKAAAAKIQGIKVGLISGIPSKCGVNIPYAISPSTNCATVK